MHLNGLSLVSAYVKRWSALFAPPAHLATVACAEAQKVLPRDSRLVETTTYVISHGATYAQIC